VAKQKTKSVALSAGSVRKWAKQAPFKVPRGLEAKRSVERGKPAVVLSFPVPRIDWQKDLTAAEIDVVQDVLAGLSNAEIGERRGTALRTIANQVAAIFRKLGVSSRLELSLSVLSDRATLRRR